MNKFLRGSADQRYDPRQQMGTNYQGSVDDSCHQGGLRRLHCGRRAGRLLQWMVGFTITLEVATIGTVASIAFKLFL